MPSEVSCGRAGSSRSDHSRRGGTSERVGSGSSGVLASHDDGGNRGNGWEGGDRGECGDSECISRRGLSWVRRIEQLACAKLYAIQTVDILREE